MVRLWCVCLRVWHIAYESVHILRHDFHVIIIIIITTQYALTYCQCSAVHATAHSHTIAIWAICQLSTPTREQKKQKRRKKATAWSQEKLHIFSFDMARAFFVLSSCCRCRCRCRCCDLWFVVSSCFLFTRKSRIDLVRNCSFFSHIDRYNGSVYIRRSTFEIYAHSWCCSQWRRYSFVVFVFCHLNLFVAK